jgi:Flp pilus assembly protein TadG
MRTRSRRGRPFGRFLRASDGATAVEFTLIAFPFLGVIFAIFEIAYVHVEREMLAGAVTKAARALIVGQVQSNATAPNRTTFVNTYLCPSSGPRLMPAAFDCSQLAVDVRPVSSFSGNDMSNAIYRGSTVFCPGKPSEIVLMRVTYPLPAILPFNLFGEAVGVVTDVPNRNGRYHIIMGTALFQSEAYTASYTPPSGC